jgi:N6-adenosine-specific RNA methylase IME4
MTTETHNQLTAEERYKLQGLEDTIRRGLQTFLAVGSALQEIHDAHLYRETHGTFEDYCRDKWGLKERLAYKYMDASQAVGNLGSCPIGQLPANEAQARPLTTLRDDQGGMDPELQRAAWSRVVERAGDDPVTARLVEEVVREIKDCGPQAESQEEARSKRFSGIEPFPPEETTPPLPEGTFSVILADPPWRYDFSRDRADAIEAHYSTMSLEDICSLSVAEKAAPDCVLFLWTTSPKLFEAREVIERWGFTYKTSAVWRKQGAPGLGYYFRVDHEFLLVATKGSPRLPRPSDRLSSVIDAPKGRHSAKPGIVHRIIERMYPAARRLELFARSERPGWSAWGNQADGGPAEDRTPELEGLDIPRGEVLPITTFRLMEPEEFVSGAAR